MTYPLKCIHCGKFIKQKDFKDKIATLYFQPLSDVSTEINYAFHHKCRLKLEEDALKNKDKLQKVGDKNDRNT